MDYIKVGIYLLYVISMNCFFVVYLILVFKIIFNNICKGFDIMVRMCRKIVYKIIVIIWFKFVDY